MTRNIGVFLIFLGACDPVDKPTCSDWLRCYDTCNPWNCAGNEPRCVPDPAVVSLKIEECDVQCRTELDYETETESPSGNPLSSGVGWRGVVSNEQAVAAGRHVCTPPCDDWLPPDIEIDKFLRIRGRCAVDWDTYDL